VRIALRSALQEIGDVVVVGEASTNGELVQQARCLAPDVVLVNPRLPGGDAADACRALGTLDRPPIVVALASYFCSDEARRLRAAGAAHYVVKEVNVRTLATLLQSFGQFATVES
jgi:DNA-binding NarL/FixJ family response regulator